MPPPDPAPATLGWKELRPATSPSPRQWPAMVHAAPYAGAILYGGDRPNSKQLSDETWEYQIDQNSWLNLTSSTRPPPLFGHSMVYDTQGMAAVLFGGDEGSAVRDVTWTYTREGNTWQDMAPSPRPAARRFHAMAYDRDSQRTVLYGGLDTSSSQLNDTWTYDLKFNLWTPMNPPTNPGARSDHSMAYDSKNDRVLLFGGLGGAGDLADTWTYDLDNNSWMKLQTTGPPGLRTARMDHDPAGGKFLLFGGMAGGAGYNRTWTFDLQSVTWQDVTPSLSPPARLVHAMTFDVSRSIAIVFGGWREDLSERLGDTWGYGAWGGTGAPSEPRGLTLKPLDSRVDLNWSVPIDDGGSPITAYRIYRATPPGTATKVAETAGLTHSDTGLTNDQMYFYSVSAVNAAGEGPRTLEVCAKPVGAGGGPPTVIATVPLDMTLGVSLTADINVTFDVAMEEPVTGRSISIFPSLYFSGISVSYEKEYSWSHYTEAFRPQTKYTVTITTSARSVSGVNMASPFSFSFVTGDNNTGPGPEPAEVVFSVWSHDIKVGEQTRVAYKVFDSAGRELEMGDDSWTAAPAGVANITADGWRAFRVEGAAPGKVTITVTVKGPTKSATNSTSITVRGAGPGPGPGPGPRSQSGIDPILLAVVATVIAVAALAAAIIGLRRRGRPRAGPAAPSQHTDPQDQAWQKRPWQ